jgi:hypothetical protein
MPTALPANRSMTRLRSTGDIAAQPAISARVRPQPVHVSDCKSSVQILTQGVSISVLTTIWTCTWFSS